MSQKIKYKLAVSLGYEQNDLGEEPNSDGAPQVTLKAENLDADQLVKLAQRYGIPVVEKPELARALNSLAEGHEIPEELYQAVALLLHEIEKQA